MNCSVISVAKTPLLCSFGAGGGFSSKPANADGLLGPSLTLRSATSGIFVSYGIGCKKPPCK